MCDLRHVGPKELVPPQRRASYTSTPSKIDITIKQYDDLSTPPSSSSGGASRTPRKIQATPASDIPQGHLPGRVPLMSMPRVAAGMAVKKTKLAAPVRSSTPPVRTASPPIRSRTPVDTVPRTKVTAPGSVQPAIVSSSGREARLPAPRSTSLPKRKQSVPPRAVPGEDPAGGDEKSAATPLPAPNVEAFLSEVARELATVISQSQRKTVDALLRLPSASAETASAIQEVLAYVTDRHQHMFRLAQLLTVVPPSPHRTTSTSPAATHRATKSPVGKPPDSSFPSLLPLFDSSGPPSLPHGSISQWIAGPDTPRGGSPVAPEMQYQMLQQSARLLREQQKALQDDCAVLASQMQRQKDLFYSELASAMQYAQSTAPSAELTQQLADMDGELQRLRLRLAEVPTDVLASEATLRQENAVLQKQLERVRAKHVEELTRLKTQAQNPSRRPANLHDATLRELRDEVHRLRLQLVALRACASEIPSVSAVTIAATVEGLASGFLSVPHGENESVVLQEENKMLAEENLWLKEQLTHRGGLQEFEPISVEACLEEDIHDVIVRLVSLTEWAIGMHGKVEAGIREVEAELTALNSATHSPGVTLSDCGRPLSEMLRRRQESHLTQLMQFSADLASGAARMSEITTDLTSDRGERIHQMVTALDDDQPSKRTVVILKEHVAALQQENQQLLKHVKRDAVDNFPMRELWATTIQRLEMEKGILEVENEKLRFLAAAPPPLTENTPDVIASHPLPQPLESPF
eukprot:GGOE01036863.1.p1 GENE.GGOE01036863.1~~GGOE01036863.1.p1  ORF type:complete len:752 (-),score=180.62 GGOE01036863.1:137-2392(-)